ncbi:hypothetical protein Ccrd_025536, partial [Cynara cardunculus var. scolymus]
SLSLSTLFFTSFFKFSQNSIRSAKRLGCKIFSVAELLLIYLNPSNDFAITMHSIKNTPPFAFLLLLLALFFIFANGEPYFSTFRTPTSGKTHEGKYDLLDSWGTKRLLAEEQNDVNSSLVLAQKRTTRKDPLDDFKKYRGGWNISERHYWASVAFTAAPFFVMAAAWFVIFGLCLSLICLCYCCCSRTPIGCVFLYTGQAKFYHSTTKTLDYVVNQANTTAEKLRNLSDDFASAKKVGVAQVFLPFFRCLFLLAVLSIFGMQCMVYTLVIFGWILVTGTFILCGVFLVLHKPDFTDRACTPNEVSLNNATQVYSQFVCEVSPSGICTTTGRLTPDFYSQMSAGIKLSYGLYLYGPFLVDLQDCTFVRQTFTDITQDYCPGLRRYSNWIYIGLLMVSLAVLLSLVFWVIYGRERRHRVYTKTLVARTDGEKGM